MSLNQSDGGKSIVNFLFVLQMNACVSVFRLLLKCYSECHEKPHWSA